jgi:FkbM family methyltransferase
MKKIIKRLLKIAFGSQYRAIIIAIRGRKNFLLTKLKGGYFSINQLDRQLEEYVNYDNGFFVELGANDGVSQSNSLYFEMKRNWRGVLIEPSPHNFLLCKEQRSKRNHIFCNACVSYDYKEKYVDIRYANLMSISQNLELDLNDKDAHISNGEKNLSNSEEVFSFGAVAATLNSLLKKSNAPKEIDFLSLDVEGAELEVLKGIDFDEFTFKYMLIELRDTNRIENFLNNYGYKLEKKFSAHDYLFSKIQKS